MMTERIADDHQPLAALPPGTDRMVRVHPLTIGAVFDDAGTVGHGYVLNLSLGGVFLTTQSILHMGDRLRLRFFLPFRAGPVDAQVVVRWRTHDLDQPERMPATGYGLEFVDIDPRELASLNRFISEFVRLAGDID